MEQMFFKGDVVEVLKAEADNWYQVGEKYVVTGWNDGENKHHEDPDHITVEGEDKDVWVVTKHVRILSRAWQENIGKRPVGDDVFVDVEFNSGKRGTDRAGEWLWKNGEEPFHIAKWRIADNVSSASEDQRSFGAPADEIINRASKENEMQGCDFKVGDIVKRVVWVDIHSNTPTNGEEWKISGVEYKQGGWYLGFEGDSQGVKWEAKSFTLVSGRETQKHVSQKVEQSADTSTKQNKYSRQIKPNVFVDVYDVLRAFDVTDPCLSHLAKKALCAGLRVHKNRLEDLKDIKASVERAIEMHLEWEGVANE